MTVRGSCLCGRVTFVVDGPLRPVVACHCIQCRKTSGHFAAATAAERSTVEITGAVTWYRSSGEARRGFCTTCGASLFWEQEGSSVLSIFAGALDAPTGLSLAGHIFCASKGDYYEIADDLPRHPARDEHGVLTHRSRN